MQGKRVCGAVRCGAVQPKELRVAAAAAHLASRRCCRCCCCLLARKTPGQAQQRAFRSVRKCESFTTVACDSCRLAKSENGHGPRPSECRDGTSIQLAILLAIRNHPLPSAAHPTIHLGATHTVSFIAFVRQLFPFASIRPTIRIFAICTRAGTLQGLIWRRCPSSSTRFGLPSSRLAILRPRNLIVRALFAFVPIARPPP